MDVCVNTKIEKTKDRNYFQQDNNIEKFFAKYIRVEYSFHFLDICFVANKRYLEGIQKDNGYSQIDSILDNPKPSTKIDQKDRIRIASEKRQEQ